MIRSAVLLSAAGLVLSAGLAAQTATHVNWKFLFNENQIDAVTRQSAAANDTLYLMPPQEHLLTVSKVTGWEVILQDQNYNTIEPVDFGLVKFANDNQSPDTTSNPIINGTLNLQFPKPANGNASVGAWEITFNPPPNGPGPVDAGERHGIRLIFRNAAPGNPPTDGVWVFTQYGNSLKLPASVTPGVYAYALVNNVATTYFQAGTTLYASPTYYEPVIRNMTRSMAYGQSDDLFGPEALTPDVGRGDQVAWEVYSDTHKNQVAVLMLGFALLPKPIDIPWGRFYMAPPTGLFNFPLPLDANGVAKSVPIPAPGGLKIYAQSAFIDLTKADIRLSDIVEMNTK